jgi:hypothetical protein
MVNYSLQDMPASVLQRQDELQMQARPAGGICGAAENPAEKRGSHPETQGKKELEPPLAHHYPKQPQ